jgi:S-adenosylmethionine hydrolase
MWARAWPRAPSAEQVGPALPADSVVRIAYQKAVRNGDTIRGIIPVLDVKYGNVWTNIPKPLFEELKIGVHDKVQVRILHKGKQVQQSGGCSRLLAAWPKADPLVYLNSLLDVAVAIARAFALNTRSTPASTGKSKSAKSNRRSRNHLRLILGKRSL